LCEQAASLGADQTTARRQLLEQACAVAPQAARPQLALADLLEAQGDARAALNQRLQMAQNMPAMMPLLASGLARLAVQHHRVDEVRALLQTHAQAHPSLDVMEALVVLDQAQGVTDVQQRYATHLEKEPSMVAARLWLSHEPLQHESHRGLLERALERAAAPLKRYRCAACGFEAQQHFWQCPGCQAWDSYPPRRVEEL
jgi:lipopolysaccharide biosynthesis regulator YciM